MKKARKFSLFMVTVLLVNILSLATAITVSAATESAAYIIADFEDGTIGNTDGNTFSLVDGPGVSQKALKITDGATLPAFDFALRSQPTYADATWKYNVSAWIRADAAVGTDKVEFIFTMGEGADTYTYTHTVNGAGLVKGEWVKIKTAFEYKGTYTATVGTVKVKVSDGIAYTMDDLVIMPDKYTPMQTKTQNPILATKLDDLSAISGTTSPWKVASATAYELTTAYQGTTVTAFGNTETIGKAVKVTNADYYTEVDYYGANFKFGTEYTVEFMAKAENADAVNMVPRVVITYYSNGDENLGTWAEFPVREGAPAYADVSTNSLADGWKKFKVNVRVNKVTTTTVKSNICFRLGGDNVTTAQWSIANVDMYPTQSEFTNLSTVSHFTGSRLDDGTVYADLSSSLMTGQYKAYESRLEIPYGEDYVIYKRYTNAENKDSFIYSGIEIENARLVTNVCDKDNYFSKTYITPIEMKSSKLTAVAEMDQTVWAPDMPNLTATVRYNDASGSETLLALCAMYDENNKMVSYDEKDLEIAAGEGQVKLSMKTDSTAVKAKVFLWEKGTYAPRLDNVAEITKTTTGNFIYVDAEKGKANFTYGYNNPLKTVNQAVQAASQLAGQKKDIYIILMPGRHPVSAQVSITQAITDASHKLTFVSYDKNDKGIISGATDISGKFEEYENGIWRAPVSSGTESRQLYVNGVKAIKARTRDLSQTEFTNTSTRSESNVHQLATLGAITTSAAEWQFLANVKRPEDLEFVFFSLWTKNSCQAASVSTDGAGTVTFNMDSPGWSSLNTQYNTYARNPLYIENAYEFIDEPGEWYLDSTGGYVYYMPRAYENMDTAEVMLPTLDNDEQYLVRILGTASESVKNLTFDNVVFSHTTWNRPNTAVGHAAAQNNLLSDYYKEAGATRYSQERLRTIESAIDLENASNVAFTGCEFSKLGGNGIRVFWNVQDCEIRGCEFYDISSSAIHIGDANTEDDTKYGQLTNGANIQNVTVSDNYIHHVANDFWSAAAVGVTWAKNTVIEHNEIAYIPYSGMHIGIGWEATADAEPNDLTIDVKNNYIHDTFCYGYIYDGAPIYTNGLTGGSAQNPNEISGNYIEGVGPGAASIYNDEGSTYYYVHDNVMDTRESWSEYCRVTGELKGEANTQNINLTSNVRPHGLVWENNYVATRKSAVQAKAYTDESNSIDNCIQIGSSGEWSADAKEIIANAGIRGEYRDNFRYGLRELSVIDEIELKVGESISAVPTLLTSKNEGYKNNSLECTATSSDPTVVKIEGSRIVAVAAGMATVTYEVIENGVRHTATTTVTVPFGEDYIADLTAYRMSFENGGSLRLMKSGIGYFNVQEASATTNGSETFQIVANPAGNGKVVKLDLAGGLAGDASSVALSVNTASSSTGHAKATLPAGSTITYTFKYYWAQEMSTDNTPEFCIYNATGGIFSTGTDFSAEAGKWHTAVLTYTNTTGASINIGNAQIRFCGKNAPARTWTAKTISDGTTYGARTVYIDNVTATIK